MGVLMCENKTRVKPQIAGAWVQPRVACRGVRHITVAARDPWPCAVLKSRRATPRNHKSAAAVVRCNVLSQIVGPGVWDYRHCGPRRGEELCLCATPPALTPTVSPNPREKLWARSTLFFLGILFKNTMLDLRSRPKVERCLRRRFETKSLLILVPHGIIMYQTQENHKSEP
jgi:hypothetical protein